MVSSKIVSVAVVVLIAQIAVISGSEVAEDSPAEVVQASLPKLSLGEACKPDPTCVKPPCKCSHHEPTTPKKVQTPSKQERKSRSPDRRKPSPERKVFSEKNERQASPRKSRSPVRNGAASPTKTRATSPGKENAQRKGATSPPKKTVSKVEAAPTPAENQGHKHSCCGHHH